MDRALQAQIDAEPDATLTELQAWLATEHGLVVGRGTVIRAVARLDRPRKKSLIATERDPEQRAAWHQDQARLVADDLVFLDETSTQITLTRRHGPAPWAPAGRGGSPQHGRNVTCLAALRTTGWDHPWSSKVRSMDRSLPSGCARSWCRPCDRVRS
ncbi:MAG: hypothetical protein M9947_05305 [Thermomicrobiales bacterium]|nr:hypothetical protein [Thermomicrobiales bacterium]